jgi:hypothetical protein
VYLNVNEQNIVDVPNDLDRNSHIIIQGPEVSATISNPSLSFRPLSQTASYDVSVRQGEVWLSLPEKHPIRVNRMSDDVMRFLAFQSIRVHGSYTVHRKQAHEKHNFTDSLVRVPSER